MVPVSEKAEVEGRCLKGKSEVILMQLSQMYPSTDTVKIMVV